MRAAYILGVALPAMETLRRRTNFDSPAAYLDDFVVGGLLLVAAIAVTRGVRYGRAMLIAAWGVLCGGMWGSFFGQISAPTQADISGLSHGIVITIKGAVYLVAIAAMVLSIRHLDSRAL